MRTKTQILIAATIAFCLISPQYANAAGDSYLPIGQQTEYGADGVLQSLTMTPSNRIGPTIVSGGGSGNFQVDSFFDVFTELTLPQGNYNVDSFFDITYKIDLGDGTFAVDSFFDITFQIDLDVPDGDGPVITSMSPLPDLGSIRGTIPSPGETKVRQLGDGTFHVDSFFDIFTELSVDGGGGTFTPGAGPTLIQSFPAGIPSPRLVPGKEYSHHADVDAPPLPPVAPDPMQNIAWDGTGHAWDTFDYDDATNIPYPDQQWPQGTNVDAIANIQDYLFEEVITDQAALLVTIDFGAAIGGVPVPTDYENIHYQTAGGPGAGIWARGVVAGPPTTSDIHTVAVQTFEAGTPDHSSEWLNPTGIEVWGSEVKPPEDQGIPGTGDDAIMFSTNDEWDAAGNAKPAVWKYDPVAKLVFPYIMADQIRASIDNAALKLVEDDRRVDLDGMMVFDVEKDDEFGPGDIIMFTIHTLRDTSGGIILDGGEIWVWKFDDGVNGAQFLNHGGYVWDTANMVSSIFPNVQAEENIGGLEAVPEPATMSILALGALAMLKRKRRKA